MKNEEAMANFILKEAEAKESLRKRISESAWEYYTGRYFFRSIMDLLFIGSLFYISRFKWSKILWPSTKKPTIIIYITDGIIFDLRPFDK